MSATTPDITRVTPTSAVRVRRGGNGALGVWLTRIVLIATCFLTLLPAIWVVTDSLSPGSSAFSADLIPSSVTLQHYQDVIGNGFFIWLKNSVIVSGTVGLVSLTINTLAAYAYSRLRFVGRRYGLLALFVIQVFPATMNVPIFYTLLSNLGLIDALPGLILVFLGSSAFEIWLLKNYIDAVPRELDESGRIDGASALQIFYRIMLPLIRPMLITVFIWNFAGTYADVLFSSLVLQSPDNYTVMVGLFHLVDQQYATNWATFAAGAAMAATPILVIYLALQRQLIAGLAAGSVKG